MGGRGIFLRVGLLVLLGGGAIVGLVLFLSGNTFSNGVELETYFRESVQGLDVGAPVNYLGVTLGRVNEIGLVTAEYGQGMPLELRRSTYRLVFVRFVVNPRKIGRVLTPDDIKRAVTAGLRARIASQGITGISYLALDFVDPEQYPAQQVPWNPAHPYIPSVPSTFAQVQSAAEALANQLQQINFKTIAAALLNLTQTLEKQLTNGDAHQTLAAATALLRSLQNAIDKTDLPALSASLRKTSDAADNIVASGQTRALLTNADRAASELAVAAHALPPLIAELSTTADRTSTVTAELERSMTGILANLQAAASNLRDTTDELRSYPAGTIFGGPPPRSRADGR
ncbi:MAG TPA: MlaD family protein [Acetobacteraceae bacterium]|nr:MlaD family protein [Acetobacteraceae bacterium]